MSAIVPNLLRGNAWFSSKAAVTAAEHKVVEQCQDPSRCLNHENRSRPAVVVFIHLPKTGGTAVRTIFERSGWHLTLWSLSQRRFLRAIEDALISANQSAAQNGCRLNRPKRCAARVFVEWHLSPYNLSFVGTIEQRVRELRPDALFRSFLILRHPVQFVASNGAFWRPHLLAEDVVRLGPELLLFELMDAGMQFHRSVGAYWASNASSEPELSLSREQLLAMANHAPSALASLHLKLVRALHKRDGQPGNWTPRAVVTESDVPPCAASLEYERCKRIGEMEAAQRERYIRDKKGHGIRPDEQVHVRREAERELRRAGERRAYVQAMGCAAVSASAMAALSHVQEVMVLGDPWTLPTIQAAALGDLSFRPRSAWLSDNLKPPVQLATPSARKDKYKEPATMRAALEENACSIRFFEEVNQTRLWS